MKHISKYILILCCAIIISCQSPGGESTGSEFMPDMAHSVAYEANYYNYYYNNTWGSEEDYYKYAQPRLPVSGTIPRGSSANISIPTANDSKPYYYGDTEDERKRAIAEIIDNPLPITDAGIKHGKELYNIYCGICHGEKGDGLGYIYDVTEAYPVAPKRLIKGTSGVENLDMEMVDASNGRYYHAIMYGLNLMGSYKDKMSHDERWNVIHYIRSLQAKDMKLEYNQYSNTLNSVDRPAGDIVVAELHSADQDANHSHEGIDHDTHQHDKEDGHGHDDDGHDHDGHEGEGHDNNSGHHEEDNH